MQVKFTADSNYILMQDPNLPHQYRKLHALIWDKLLKSMLLNEVLADVPSKHWWVTQSWDHVMRVRNQASGDVLAILRGHTNFITSVNFSPDHSRIASAADDKMVWIWNMGTGDLEFVIREHDSRVRAVTFSLDGNRVTSVSDRIIVWNVAAEAKHDILCTEAEFIRFYPKHLYDNHRVPDSDSGFCRWPDIWKATKNQFDPKPLDPNLYYFKACNLTSTVFSPDGSHIAYMDIYSNRQLLCCNIATGTTQIYRHEYEMVEIMFSPDGCHTAGVSPDAVEIWDAVTGRREAMFKADRTNLSRWQGRLGAGAVSSVAFSLDGQYIMLRQSDMEASMMLAFELATGKAEPIQSGGLLPNASGGQAWLDVWERIHVVQPSVDIRRDHDGNMGHATVMHNTVSGLVPVSVSEDRKWVVCAGDPHFCSISPSYCNYTVLAYSGALIFMGFQDGRVAVLDTNPEKVLG